MMTINSANSNLIIYRTSLLFFSSMRNFHVGNYGNWVDYRLALIGVGERGSNSKSWFMTYLSKSKNEKRLRTGTNRMKWYPWRK